MNFSEMFLAVFEMSAVASVIAIIVMLIRKFAGNVVRRSVIFALWGVVILKFLIPVSIPSPVSLYNVVDFENVPVIESVTSGSETVLVPEVPVVTVPSVEEPVIPVTPVTPQIPSTDSIVQSPVIPEASEPQGEVQSPVISDTPAEDTLPMMNGVSEEVVTPSEQMEGNTDYFGIASKAYCIVTSVIAALIVAAYSFTAYQIGKAETVCDERVDRILVSLSALTKIRVRTRVGQNSIMIFGILRPTVILPEDYKDFSDTELTYLIMHEYQHYRHLDTLWNLLMLVSCAVHWFNPIVWMSRKFFLCDMETACDTRVLKGLPDSEKSVFANVLVSFAARCSRDRTVVAMGFGKRNVKERVLSIMKYKKTGIVAATVSVIVLIAVVAVFATGALDRNHADTSVTDLSTETESEKSTSDKTTSEETDPKETVPDYSGYHDYIAEAKMHKIAVERTEEYLARAEGHVIYDYMLAIAENDVEALAHMATTYPGNVSYDEYLALYEPLRGIELGKCYTYFLGAQYYGAHYMEIEVKSSSYDKIKPGIYDVFVGTRYNDTEKDAMIPATRYFDIFVNEELEIESDLKGLVTAFAPYCTEFNSGKDVSDDAHELRRLGMVMIIFRSHAMSIRENASSEDDYMLTLEQIAEYARDIFGVEDFEADLAWLRLSDSGKYRLNDRLERVLQFEGKYSVVGYREADGVCQVDLRFYSDILGLLEGPLVRYTLTKTDGVRGYRFDTVETVEEGNEPFLYCYYIMGTSSILSSYGYLLDMDRVDWNYTDGYREITVSSGELNAKIRDLKNALASSDNTYDMVFVRFNDIASVTLSVFLEKDDTGRIKTEHMEVNYKGNTYEVSFDDVLEKYPGATLDIVSAGDFVSVGMRHYLGTYYVFMDGGYSVFKMTDDVGYYVWSEGETLWYMKQNRGFERISEGVRVFADSYSSPEQFYMDYGKIVSFNEGKLSLTETKWTTQDYFMSQSFVMAEERERYGYTSVDSFVNDYRSGTVGEPPVLTYSVDEFKLDSSGLSSVDRERYEKACELLRDYVISHSDNGEGEVNRAIRIGSKDEFDAFVDAVNDISPLLLESFDFDKFGEAFFADSALVLVMALSEEMIQYNITLEQAVLSGAHLSFEIQRNLPMYVELYEPDWSARFPTRHPMRYRSVTSYQYSMFFVSMNRDAYKYADSLSVNEYHSITPLEYLYKNGEYQWTESFRNTPFREILRCGNIEEQLEACADNKDKLGPYVNEFPIKVFETYDELYDFILKISYYESNMDVLYQLVENYDNGYFEKNSLVIAIGNEVCGEDVSDETDVEFCYEIENGKMTVLVHDLTGYRQGRTYLRFFNMTHEELAGVTEFSCRYDDDTLADSDAQRPY